jgi:predicted HTH transcriptional regulator
VSRQQEENLQRDFKTLVEPNMERGDDKRHLAEMLSAFANSSGGLIVLGRGREAQQQWCGLRCRATENTTRRTAVDAAERA